MKTYLALDIGGSGIKCAVMKEDASFVRKFRHELPEDSLSSLIDCVKEIAKENPDVSGIAISMPGMIDAKNGFAHTGGILHCVKDVYLAKELEEVCGLPVTIENDASCAGMAEVGFGNLSDVEDSVAVILGSGIGGCLIRHRHVETGRHFSAGEFSYLKMNEKDPYTWNSTLDYECGREGLSRLTAKHTGENREYTGIETFQMAENGDQNAIRAIDEFSRKLAFALFNIHVVFDCEKIAIGGGISVQPLLIESIQRNFQDLYDHLEYPFPQPEIVPCRFHNDANLIGALYVHLQHGEEHEKLSIS